VCLPTEVLPLEVVGDDVEAAVCCEEAHVSLLAAKFDGFRLDRLASLCLKKAHSTFRSPRMLIGEGGGVAGIKARLTRRADL